MSLIILSLVLLFASTLVGVVATGIAVRLSHATGILDYPSDPRKVHRKPIAYLGGMGFTATVLLGLGLYALLVPFEALRQQELMLAFIAGLVAIFAVGLWDDVAGMRPIVKLGAQLAVGLGLWLAGVRIERLNLGLGQPWELIGTENMGWTLYLATSWPSALITMFWYAALINAINLIDGLDGLAGGVSLIAGLSLGAVAIIVAGNGADLSIVLPILAAGACAGFLYHNWHPARIFLGDSGSLAIGYTLATASLVGSTKAPALLTLLIPLVALGLPLFETTFSFTRRIIAGQHPFKADRRHLHHRLLDVGLDQQRVVMIFWFATAYLGVNAILLAQARSMALLINVIMLGLGVTMLIEYLSFFEKRRNSRDDN